MKNINTTLKEDNFEYENNYLVLTGNDDVKSFLEYLTNQLDDIDGLNIMEAIFAAQMENSPYYQDILGLCYFVGYGCKENHSIALSWWEKAAKQDDDCAMYFLGRCFLYGDGAEKDCMKAKSWLECAAKKGHNGAQVMLGNMYCDGLGIANNHSEAVSWYKKAAKSGNPEAMFRLYACYAIGQGVRRNMNRATDYLYKSAIQGYQDAINEIKRLKELVEG